MKILELSNYGVQQMNVGEIKEVGGGEYQAYIMMDKESAAWVADGSATMGGIVAGAIASFVVGMWSKIF